MKYKQIKYASILQPSWEKVWKEWDRYQNVWGLHSMDQPNNVIKTKYKGKRYARVKVDNTEYSEITLGVQGIHRQGAALRRQGAALRSQGAAPLYD